MKERCGNCRYYRLEMEFVRNHQSDEELHRNDFEAECRRYPPARDDPKYSGEMADAVVLADCFSGPIVNTLYWCGEWSPRAT